MTSGLKKSKTPLNGVNFHFIQVQESNLRGQSYRVFLHKSRAKSELIVSK